MRLPDRLRLPRLLRTSIFRLTLLYVGLFGASVVLLFGLMVWTASDFMARQIDDTVTSELAEVEASAAAHPGSEGLREAIQELTERSPGIYYLLEKADGSVAGGNLPPLGPVAGLRILGATATPVPGSHFVGIPPGGVRGRGVVLGDGSYVFVGLSGAQLTQMQRALMRALASGLALTLLVAVFGGLAMSLGMLRRIEAISRASRDIMAGDLGRRIAMRGTDDEFDRLSASLNTMLDRIQALMRGLEEVSSDIAHDLRTPLTRLRQRLELARRREHTLQGLHEALEASICDADGILETFGALLRIAQIESGARRAGFDELGLSALLGGLVDTYHPVAEEGGRSLQGRITNGLRVRGDRQLLTQLFSNLLENAIYHTAPCASLLVELTAAGGWVTASVSDDGPGIPAALLSKVTQRFFRLEQSRTSPGNGLGLSLVEAIATLHDTRLELHDNQPGLRCVVRLREAHLLRPADSRRPAGTHPPALSSSGGRSAAPAGH